MDEYFHKPKVRAHAMQWCTQFIQCILKHTYIFLLQYYLAVNVNGNHWVTVVMHVPKKEFQVLDSLYVLRSYIHIIEALVCFHTTLLCHKYFVKILIITYLILTTRFTSENRTCL
jgi:hypothetical protein